MVNIFERTKENINILRVVEHYGFVKIKSSSDKFTIKCPFHDEKTPSCMIYTNTNSYYCWGACASGGDVINFFSKMENLTPLQACYRMSEIFGFNLPALSKEDTEQMNETELYKDILTTANKYFVSNMTPEIYKYIEREWGINEETSRKFGLGWAPVENNLLDFLNNAADYDYNDIAKTNLLNDNGNWEFFNGRITIPFFRAGKVIYYSGRYTHKTPKNKYEFVEEEDFKTPRKYKNLAKADHGPQDLLFNGDILHTSVSDSPVIITEGLMDCIRCHQSMKSCITYGGINIPEPSINRIIKFSNHIKKFIICFDSDANGAGQKASNKLAHRLNALGKNVNIIEFPLTDGQRKEDVCSYIQKEGEDKFDAIIEMSKNVIELNISKMPDFSELNATERVGYLRPVFDLISKTDPVSQDTYVDLVQAQTGMAKRVISKALKEYIDSNTGDRAGSDSLNLPLKNILANIRAVNGNSNQAIAETTFNWIKKRGGKFFVDPKSQPYLFYQNDVYRISPDERPWKVFLSSIGDLNYQCSEGRFVFEAITNMACEKGQKIDSYSWEHTDIKNDSIFISLNNTRKEIIKMSPNNVEVMPNGSNAYNVLLSEDDMSEPVTFLKNPNIHEGQRLIKELIFDSFSCSEEDKFMILSWILTYPFIEYQQMKPLMRFEGDMSSGKSTAAKVLTAFVYGKEQLKMSTDAANYSSAARRPLACYDNIENKDLTEQLRQYFITSATGIQREKRVSGSSDGVMAEKAKCLNFSTGIEPFWGAELISRMLISRFNSEYKNPGFIETIVLKKIEDNRDVLFMTCVDIWANHVLPYICSDKYVKLTSAVKVLFDKNNSKDRAYECLTIMTIIAQALLKFLPKPNLDVMELEDIISDDAIDTDYMDWLNRDEIILLGNWIKIQNEESFETQMGTNDTSMLFEGMYHQYKNNIALFNHDHSEASKKILEEYGIKFNIEYIEGDRKAVTFKANTKELYIAFCKFCKHTNISAPSLKNAMTLNKRIQNDINILRKNNWYMTKINKRNGVYEFKYFKIV